ncbi:hypothetical protein F7Q92_02325 [Ideonella dechloratans]|uniref:Uncharacterized protein n=1 Tax=Ideonella dechloratans TaxID=36863 RepID=A0A643FHB9_IDEDE|nr:hypothetical protein [Ideonella dechloratans]KAB0584689.1 hypothetical protein F7Q92_02325 [Ideonella dechloratans]UFU12309.1 hypothetical protein LRM40_18095 [Ideonella dechloratans]
MLLHFLLADSELAWVRQDGTTLILRFSAAQAERRESSPTERPVIGYAPGVLMQLQDATPLPAGIEALFGRVESGVIRSGSERWTGCPLPFASPAPVQLELVLARHGPWQVAASAFSVGFEGEPNFRESWAC